MAATRAGKRFECSACGATQRRWTGQCPECGQWDSLSEVTVSTAATHHRHGGFSGETATLQRLDQVAQEQTARYSTGIAEFDRSLGGGLVRGSVTLVGGDPGIGKSTLLLQMLAHVEVEQSIYVSGEESPAQVALRARRLGLASERLQLLSQTHLETVLATAAAAHPAIMVIDSIQTLFSDQLTAAPGAVGQVRECAAQLVRFAKQTGSSLVLVGHVTKEGAIAGPRVLEHMVDTVLYFEGEVGSRYRVLRAVKNRFGAVNELGLFAMTEQGLKGVNNPSAMFLSRHEQPVPGSLVMVSREGTRPLLVEVQALVADSHGAQPRRLALGLEANRLGMLLAVLQRHGGITIGDQDVYLNVVGGMRIAETAADLPVVLAALSSFRNRAIPKDWVAFGELGLAGEIRPVPHGEERLKEAVKHGFRRALLPQANAPRQSPRGIEVTPLRRLADAIDVWD